MKEALGPVLAVRSGRIINWLAAGSARRDHAAAARSAPRQEPQPGRPRVRRVDDRRFRRRRRAVPGAGRPAGCLRTPGPKTGSSAGASVRTTARRALAPVLSSRTTCPPNSPMPAVHHGFQSTSLTTSSTSTRCTIWFTSAPATSWFRSERAARPATSTRPSSRSTSTRSSTGFRSTRSSSALTSSAETASSTAGSAAAWANASTRGPADPSTSAAAQMGPQEKYRWRYRPTCQV
jgi:hypothetical protein